MRVELSSAPRRGLGLRRALAWGSEETLPRPPGLVEGWGGEEREPPRGQLPSPRASGSRTGVRYARGRGAAAVAAAAEAGRRRRHLSGE